MKTIKTSLLLLFLLDVSMALHGKAAFYSYPDMIRMSEIIAVVEVTEVEQVETKGQYWTYQEKITAKVLETVKGSPDKTLAIYGKENFICAQCRFQKGKQLVFLKRDGELLNGSNWHLAIRPITGENCEWFKDPASLELVTTPLSTVLKQVKEEIEKQKSSDTKETHR